jgi:hypothetical protein
MSTVDGGASPANPPAGPGREGKRSAEDAAQDASDAQVQRTRAWTGLIVVIGGDVAIAVAAILGIALMSKAGSEPLVAILTSAFTAISSMTSAYFGIRAASNTAQSSVQGTVRAARNAGANS